MKNTISVPAAVLLLAAGPVFAADGPSPVIKTARDWASDTGAVVSSPLHWGGSDFGKLGLVAAGAGISLVWLDDEMEDVVEKAHHNEFSVLSEKVRYLGDGAFLGPALGAAWLYGSLAEKPRLAEAARVGVESWLISGFVVGVGKLAVHRYRPKADLEPRAVSEQNFFSGANLSFPSGHSAAAFSTARVAAWYLAGKPAAPYVCYGLATLVAWSRVNDNEHWTSDVIVGSAAGYFIAGKVIKLNESRRPSGAALLPFFPGGPGLAAVYRF